MTVEPATNVTGGWLHVKHNLVCSMHSGPVAQSVHVIHGPAVLKVVQPRQFPHHAVPSRRAGVWSISAASWHPSSLKAHSTLVFSREIFCSVFLYDFISSRSLASNISDLDLVVGGDRIISSGLVPLQAWGLA